MQIWYLYLLNVLAFSSWHMTYDNVSYMLVSGFLELLFFSEYWQQWIKCVCECWWYYSLFLEVNVVCWFRCDDLGPSEFLIFWIIILHGVIDSEFPAASIFKVWIRTLKQDVAFFHKYWYPSTRTARCHKPVKLNLVIDHH